jgi:hypothetical protein
MAVPRADVTADDAEDDGTTEHNTSTSPTTLDSIASRFAAMEEKLRQVRDLAEHNTTTLPTTSNGHGLDHAALKTIADLKGKIEQVIELVRTRPDLAALIDAVRAHRFAKDAPTRSSSNVDWMSHVSGASPTKRMKSDESDLITPLPLTPNGEFAVPDILPIDKSTK